MVLLKLKMKRQGMHRLFFGLQITGHTSCFKTIFHQRRCPDTPREYNSILTWINFSLVPTLSPIRAAASGPEDDGHQASLISRCSAKQYSLRAWHLAVAFSSPRQLADFYLSSDCY